MGSRDPMASLAGSLLEHAHKEPALALYSTAFRLSHRGFEALIPF
jgi:hypothetical protein